MSKNLHEPSTPRAVAANRYTGKLTQQKPYAYDWVTPVNAADCPADPYSLTDPQPIWTPCYVNGWERPTTLEPLAVRMNSDGLLQWQGYVNAKNSTTSVAFVMPGTLTDEPDMVPSSDLPIHPGNFSYPVWVTTDDGGIILPGRARVDTDNGEVSITWGPSVFRAEQWNDVLATDAGGGMDQCIFDIWDNGNPAVFTENLDGGGKLETVTAIAGLYTITFNWNWVDTFDASHAGGFLDGTGVWPIDAAEFTRKLSGGTGDGVSYVMSATRYFPTLDFNEGHGIVDDPTFSFFIGQNTGGSEDVQGRFELVYWGLAGN